MPANRKVSMQIRQLFARGVALVLAAAIGVAAFDAAQAASKKTKHPKSPSASHSAGAPNATQPAPPGPPDPGVYK